jgi:hypothetical protein
MKIKKFYEILKYNLIHLMFLFTLKTKFIESKTYILPITNTNYYLPNLDCEDESLEHMDFILFNIYAYNRIELLKAIYNTMNKDE